MATRLQRTKAVLDAIRDADTPNATIGKVIDGFAYTHARDSAGLTNDQKAAIFLREIREIIRGTVRAAIRNQAADAAADAADSNVDLGSDV